MAVAKANAAAPANTMMAVVATAVGWLIPGAGHLIQKRWGRGLLLMAAVTTMFVLGLLMEGKLYAANTGDILDILGFIGDIGAGGLADQRSYDGRHAGADDDTVGPVVQGLTGHLY